MVARLVDTREDDDEGFPIFEADVQTTEVTSSAILTLSSRLCQQATNKLTLNLTQGAR